MQIKELVNYNEIKASFQIMTKIYPDLREDDYIINVTNAINKDYKIAAIYKEGGVIAVIGINICNDMRYGKVLVIQDFMICSYNRGIGAGKMLLKWVDWQALELKATKIISNLSSERKESHKIFLREGFVIDGISFVK
jgi:hypothetical protein